jgi:hypothetical protein
MIVQLKQVEVNWVEVKASTGAKCRGVWPEEHIIPKGNKAIKIEGHCSSGRFHAFLCEEHGLAFLKRCSNLLDEYENDSDKPWNQPNDNGESPGDICCMRATGNRCYEHNPNNYKDGKLV